MVSCFLMRCLYVYYSRMSCRHLAAATAAMMMMKENENVNPVVNYF